MSTGVGHFVIPPCGKSDIFRLQLLGDEMASWAAVSSRTSRRRAVIRRQTLADMKSGIAALNALCGWESQRATPPTAAQTSVHHRFLKELKDPCMVLLVLPVKRSSPRIWRRVHYSGCVRQGPAVSRRTWRVARDMCSVLDDETADLVRPFEDWIMRDAEEVERAFKSERFGSYTEVNIRRSQECYYDFLANLAGFCA